MAEKQAGVTALHLVGGSDVDSDSFNHTLHKSMGFSSASARDSFLHYAAQMSDEMHILASSHDCVVLAHLLKMASLEARDLVNGCSE